MSDGTCRLVIPLSESTIARPGRSAKHLQQSQWNRRNAVTVEPSWRDRRGVTSWRPRRGVTGRSATHLLRSASISAR
eukprot:3524072-Prymnesium_polylepis.2